MAVTFAICAWTLGPVVGCAFDSSGTNPTAGESSGTDASESESESDAGTTSSDLTSGTDSGSETGEPTTGEPTTGEPTTDPTEGPTTEEPTTEEPTTDDPTEEPTTEDPTTEDPTEEPTTEDPTTEDPSTTDCEASTWYEDADNDGYGDPDVQLEDCEQPDGYVDNADDCEDKGEGAEVMSPGHIEVCDDFDNDCDGVLNEYSAENSECGDCELAEFDGSVYFFCDSMENWADARDSCSENFGADVDLVQITKENENGFIQDKIGFVGRWIGASDVAEEGTWLWIDGSSVEYEDWGIGQPANWVGNEDCAQVDTNRWHSKDCSSDDRFICEGPV